jgi:hypothetical protein
MGMGKSVLYSKLAKIIGEIARVPKRGRNEFHKYDYVTEADLLDAVRAKLSEAGVAYFFSVDSATVRPGETKGGPIVDVAVTVTFADGESGETFSVKGVGSGQDSGDKGVYKALTGAQKYVVMKTFLVPTATIPSLRTPRPLPPARVGRRAAAESRGRRSRWSPPRPRPRAPAL